MTTFVYSLYDPRYPEFFRYIGISSNPEERLAEHISDVKTKNTVKSNWIKKIINEGVFPNFKILFEFENRTLAGLKEIELIKKYRSENPKHKKLTNMTIGGEGTSLFKTKFVFSKKQSKKKFKKKNVNLILCNKNFIDKLHKKELRKKMILEERKQKIENSKKIEESLSLQVAKAIQSPPKKIVVSLPKNRWSREED